MTWDYWRVSSLQQSYERHPNALHDLGIPEDRVFEDAMSGKTMNRPGWQNLLSPVRPNDLVSFSDAVVAIAITLVMLSLIELASERGASVDELFATERYRFAAAALSFVVIGSCWREHHEAFERAATDCRRLVSLNSI